jgi:hypothetical protein
MALMIHEQLRQRGDFADFARVTLLAAMALAAAFAPVAAMQVVAATGSMPAASWTDQASAGLDPHIVDTLRRIPQADRRLLALRGYLRARDTLAGRWTWSRQQLSAYRETPEGKGAIEDLDAVATAFANGNPGYELRVNPQPRSLETQVAHWNQNESVGKSAAALMAALEYRFVGQSSRPSVDQLRAALVDWVPDVAVPLAAPGLSPHGQGRAFDFQVEQHGKIIAGVAVGSASRQWDAAGWTRKLSAAVDMAGQHFSGPLRSPYEPWHYAYTPRAATPDDTLDTGTQPRR